MADLGGVSLLGMRFGTEISIERTVRGGHMAVLIPLTGSFTTRHRQKEFTCVPEGAMTVLSPGEGFHMRWSRGCTVLSLRVAAGVIDAGLRRFGHDALPGALTFDPRVADAAAVQAVRGVTQLLASVVDSYRSLDRMPRPLVRQLTEQAVSTVLVALPHNQTHAIFTECSPIVGRAVREAVDLIEAEREARCTVGDLARHAGVTVRALELGFRRELGCTPRSYLHDVRMRRAHAELVDADPADGTTVMGVATRWGFGNVGRFAAKYRKEFGINPSTTLRSARAAGGKCSVS